MNAQLSESLWYAVFRKVPESVFVHDGEARKLMSPGYVYLCDRAGIPWGLILLQQHSLHFERSLALTMITEQNAYI